MEIWQEFEIKVSVDESKVEENIWKLYGFLNFLWQLICLFLIEEKKLYIFYITQF